MYSLKETDEIISLKPLEHDIQFLGDILVDVIKEQEGDETLKIIDDIRHCVHQAWQGNQADKDALRNLLSNMDDKTMLPVARFFGHFLNLANIAEQQHRVRRLRQYKQSNNLSAKRKSFDHLLDKLLAEGIKKEKIAEAISKLSIELVLTAHPTEISRRTISLKHDKIAQHLDMLDRINLTAYEQLLLEEKLQQEITSLWCTDEIRHHKPTPVDEAKWGITAIEQTLWNVVPDFLREIDHILKAKLNISLPVDAAPVRFASWMGGDRDGNPNVTAQVTNQVCWLSRWEAAELYWNDVHELRAELSMSECNQELRKLVGDHPEPYRQLLRSVRERLARTREWLEARLEGVENDDAEVYKCAEDIKRPLMICYHSLIDCGMKRIAEGKLTDVIRRVSCFGLGLMPMDLRQESTRHAQVFDAVTRYIGLGEFSAWSEEEKQAFLLRELASSRPLIPQVFFEQKLDHDWVAKLQQEVNYTIDEVYEVLETLKIIPEHPQGSFSSYIISMAHLPSDVLAVLLLQKEAGISKPIPTMPLFETLADLNNAASSIDRLLNIDDYKQAISGVQQVMIGYSDSAKDAGFLAASWAQYRAQEELLVVCNKHGVDLRLFHGRGGSMSRGGGSAHGALLSQPPGAVNACVRITEQGEMIRFKFGLPGIALRTLELYASATLEATLLPPPKPEKKWRALMDSITARSLSAYRQMVQSEAFLNYFYLATPEQELVRLSLGSRPARRKASGGLESLRAIPWVFAWTQSRLLISAWLGTDEALEQAIQSDQTDLIAEMVEQWPYFATLIDMLEMVLAKTESSVSEFYEAKLGDESAREIGDELRDRLATVIAAVIKIRQSKQLLDNNPVIQFSIKLRNPYVIPLHFLQAEIMQRIRNSPHDKDSALEQALKITIAGIAAGMRNTG